MKKQYDIPNSETDSLNINPPDEVMPSQSSHEKQVVEFELSEPPMPELDAAQNAIVKLNVKRSCKKMKQKHIALGFQKKKSRSSYFEKIKESKPCSFELD